MTMMHDPLLVSPRYNCDDQLHESNENQLSLPTKTYLQSSRDDPEKVCHDVSDEQMRVDCVTQAA